MKKVLYSTIRQQSLDDEGFQTLLCEIEAILNGRPITKVSDDVNDLEALTPSHYSPEIKTTYGSWNFQRKRLVHQKKMVTGTILIRYLLEKMGEGVPTTTSRKTEMVEAKKKLCDGRHCCCYGSCGSSKLMADGKSN